MPSATTWPALTWEPQTPWVHRDALRLPTRNAPQLRPLLQRRTRFHCRTQRRTQPRTASAPPGERHRNDPLR